MNYSVIRAITRITILEESGEIIDMRLWETLKSGI